MSVKLEHIFCPVDISGESAESLGLPVALAKDFGAKLCFCFCAAKTSSRTTVSDLRKIKQMVEKALEFFASEPGGPPIEWKVVFIESGDLAGKIVVEAARCEADLIVMGANRQPQKNAFFSTVTESVCRRAPCPVLIARPAESQNGKPFAGINFRRILAAHDFSDHSELALQIAGTFSKKYHAEMHLLHVLAEPFDRGAEPVWSGQFSGNLYHQTIKRLQTAAGESNSIKKAAAVRMGKPYLEILRYADENKIDLIALGAHGTDFTALSMFGSNVERILRQSSCAVLVARPLKPVWAGKIA